MHTAAPRMILGALLVLIVAVAATAGGGGEAGTSEVSVSDNFNATGLPILNEPVTFRVAMIDYWNTPDFNDKQMVRDWTEMTNVAFDWIHMSGQDAQTRVPLMYATNDLPDAFIGIRQAVSDDYGAQGLNIALEEYVDRYAPNITKALDEVTAARRLHTALDGHMYHIPSVGFLSRGGQVVYSSFVRTQWLEALGESVPDSLDGFVDLLRAFRDGDPNGNGEADEIPFSVRWADSISGIRAWFHPFGTTSAFMGPMFIRDNVVQATTLQPGYRDAVKWLHSIYAEGLLDQEAFTYEIQAYRAKNQEGVIGVSSAWGGWNIVPEGSAAQAKEWWTPIPPLAGPDGSRDAEFNALAGIGNGLVITNAAEMPEALVRYVDLNFIPENAVQWSLGPLGHNLFQDDQGRIGYLPTPDSYKGYGQFRISESAVFMTNGVVPSWSARNFLPDERNQWKNSLVDLYLPHATMYGTNAVKLSADEVAEAGVYLTDINSYIQSKEAEWVVNGKIDEEWDDYVKRLNDMGMERVLEIYQTGADRWAGE